MELLPLPLSWGGSHAGLSAAAPSPAAGPEMHNWELLAVPGKLASELPLTCFLSPPKLLRVGSSVS